MRFIFLATLTTFFFTMNACTTHHKLVLPLTPAAIVQVQSTIENRETWIEHGQPGQTPNLTVAQRGQALRVGNLTPSIVLAIDHGLPPIPVEYIRRIQVTNRMEGAVRGLLVGALSGALVGTMLGSGARSQCNPGDDSCTGMDFSGAIIATSLLLGSAVGLGIGAGVGQRHIFEF